MSDWFHARDVQGGGYPRARRAVTTPHNSRRDPFAERSVAREAARRQPIIIPEDDGVCAGSPIR